MRFPKRQPHHTSSIPLELDGNSQRLRPVSFTRVLKSQESSCNFFPRHLDHDMVRTELFEGPPSDACGITFTTSYWSKQVTASAQVQGDWEEWQKRCKGLWEEFLRTSLKSTNPSSGPPTRLGSQLCCPSLVASVHWKVSSQIFAPLKAVRNSSL